MLPILDLWLSTSTAIILITSIAAQIINTPVLGLRSAFGSSLVLATFHLLIQWAGLGTSAKVSRNFVEHH